MISTRHLIDVRSIDRRANPPVVTATMQKKLKKFFCAHGCNDGGADGVQSLIHLCRSGASP
jgi:hypothetical protein